MILFFNLIGTGVIVFKSMYAIIPTMKWLRMMDQGEKGFPLVHHSLARIRLGRGILLGLDFYLVSGKPPDNPSYTLNPNPKPSAKPTLRR